MSCKRLTFGQRFYYKSNTHMRLFASELSYDLKSSIAGKAFATDGTLWFFFLSVGSHMYFPMLREIAMVGKAFVTNGTLKQS